MSIILRLKVALLLLGVAAVLAYCGNSQYQDYISKKERKARNDIETQAMIESLRRIATTHNAKVAWAKELAGKESVRISPIMSAELQHVWLTGTPILFVGTLRDISQNADGSYQVQLQYDMVSEEYLFLSTEILLNARCAAEQTAPLLKMAKDPSRLGVLADAAVVGTVSSISSNQVRDSEGEEITQLSGIATCLETMPLTHILPSKWAVQIQGK
jgi:hypothetical protein